MQTPRQKGAWGEQGTGGSHDGWAERARVGIVEDAVRNERKSQNMQSWVSYIKKGHFYCGNKRKV